MSVAGPVPPRQRVAFDNGPPSHEDALAYPRGYRNCRHICDDG